MRLFNIMHQRSGQIGKSTAEQARAANLFVVVVALPWEMIAPHGIQAVKNHDQTLERLHERGGLDAGEALAVLEDRDQYSSSITDAGAHAKLFEMLQIWQAAVERQVHYVVDPWRRDNPMPVGKLGCTHHRMTLQCPICEPVLKTLAE